MLGEMVTPIKIDISTGDAITPSAIEYDYSLMLEKRSIKLWSYNLETVLGEKLQTVLVRGVLNTRMRVFYDIYTLLLRYESAIDTDVFKQAFEATCKKRSSDDLFVRGTVIIEKISEDDNLASLWKGVSEKVPVCIRDGVFYIKRFSEPCCSDVTRPFFALSNNKHIESFETECYNGFKSKKVLQF